MANTVALCMIVKNEEKNISGLMEDTCPVLEKVIVVDTGSTDKTLTILNEKKSIYPNLQIYNFKWVNNFSEARNYSFSLAKDVDWIFWVDGDDRVDQIALKHFKDNILDTEDVDAWLLPYIYSKYPDGSAKTLLTRERFLRKNKNPRWVGAIHETVDILPLRQRNYDNLKIEHNPEGKFIEPRRNLKILESEFKKNPNDSRTAYYYAKELFDHIDPLATEKLLHYISLPFKYWDDEIGARFRLAKTYVAENKLREAILMAEPIYHLDITRRRSEYYFIFGEVEYKLRNFEVAIEWYERCLSTPPGAPRVLALEYWTWHPLKKIAECYKEMGNYEKCFAYAAKVLEILPGDVGTLTWLKEIQSYKLVPKANHTLVTLEFGYSLRQDSYKYGLEPFKIKDHKSTLKDITLSFGAKCPFETSSIDGIVIDNEIVNRAHDNVSYMQQKYPITVGELARIIKPGGFLWTKYAIKEGSEPPNQLFNFLGRAVYKNEYVFNYIRIDEKKPIISYKDGPGLHAPYRYRITNLVQSARKFGYRVIEVNMLKDITPDIYVDLTLTRKVSKINIVEVCEKLDTYNIGIEYADVINCSSKLLAEHIQSRYPNKKVINIDDHFEIAAEGWL